MKKQQTGEKVLVKLEEIKELRENEPLEILQAIDRMPEDLKQRIFPDLDDFLRTKPTDIIPLLLSNIKKTKIEHTAKVRDLVYNRLKYSDIWNDIAITYMKLKNFGKAKAILEAMLDAKASDSSTITNYGAVLLNEMLDKHKLHPENFKTAKDLTFKAFVFDVPKKGLLFKGVLMPAFKNLVLIRNIESEDFLNKGELFTSFVLGWISVEMSLLRIWSRFLEMMKYSNGKRQDMMGWDVKLIIEILSMAKIIPPEIRNALDRLRETRNRLIHGTELVPTEGEVRGCIHVGRMLIPILQ
jgi:hypothetical protein